jgi:hypothetical protein
MKQRDKQSIKIEAEAARAPNNIAELDRRMGVMTDEEHAELEIAKKLELEKRDVAFANLCKNSEKKVEKTFNKEGKVINRILWIVIDKADGTSREGMFDETASTIAW